MDQLDTSQYKVTYFLGAGASAKALPVVKTVGDKKGLADKMIELANLLKEKPEFEPLIAEFREQKFNIIEDLEYYSRMAIQFGTIDTFAKYLFLKDKIRFSQLKIVLSFYFLFEQFYNKAFDTRALVFLTTVMDQGTVFPSNIKIISWNYDSQLQLASHFFMNEEFISDRSLTFHKPPLFHYYPAFGHNFDEYITQKMDNFSLVQLNGIAGFYYDPKNELLLNDFINGYGQNDGEINVDDFIKMISRYKSQDHLLFFAWETLKNSQTISRNSLRVAQHIVKGTEILVIIGYSFPFFNRRIDSLIFDSIKIEGKLKKIVYQDPFRNGDFLKKQFNIHDSVQIEHYSSTENYYVPIEL